MFTVSFCQVQNTHYQYVLQKLTDKRLISLYCPADSPPTGRVWLNGKIDARPSSSHLNLKGGHGRYKDYFVDGNVCSTRLLRYTSRFVYSLERLYFAPSEASLEFSPFACSQTSGMPSPSVSAGAISDL